MTANPLMHLISHQDDQDQSLWPGQLMLEICLVLLYVSDFDPTRSGLGLGLFYLGESQFLYMGPILCAALSLKREKSQVFFNEDCILQGEIEKQVILREEHIHCNPVYIFFDQIRKISFFTTSLTQAIHGKPMCFCFCLFFFLDLFLIDSVGVQCCCVTYTSC